MKKEARPTVKVLDHGHVTLIDSMGSDLSVCNAARVSFHKESLEFGDKDAKLIEYLSKNGHWCYDDKTQIFTDRGWVFFSDLQSSDLVAEVIRNEDSFSFHLSVPQKLYTADYDGELIQYESKTISYAVTPNHRMLFKERTSTGLKPHWTESSAEDFFQRHKSMQCTAFWNNPSQEGTYWEGWIDGFMLGDGGRSSKNTVRIRLKVPQKIEKLRLALTACKITFSFKIVSNGVHEFRLSNNWLHKTPMKVFPENWKQRSSDYQKGIFEGLMESDGSPKHGGYAFITCSPGIMFGLEQLAVRLGYQLGVVSTRKVENPQHNPAQRTIVLTRHEGNVDPPQKERRVPYRGKVYCVTVPSGWILVRRQGKQMVCGNSPFSHPQISLAVKTPIAIRAQLVKHDVGIASIAQNEISRRYVADTPEIYHPKWRGKPTGGAKQGSSGFLEMDDPYVRECSDEYSSLVKAASSLYDKMIENGIAPEQARFVLPQGAYTEWWWTGSLAAYARIYKQRIDPHAQWECRLVAKAIDTLLRPLFPISWKCLTAIDIDCQPEVPPFAAT